LRDECLLKILKIGVSSNGKINMWKILHSKEFVQNASEFVEEFVRRVQKKHVEFDIVAGAGRKGGYLGANFAMKTMKRFISVSPSGHPALNERKYVEHELTYLEKGCSVLVIDDIFTNGIEYNKCKSLLRSFGLKVIGCAVIVWHDLSKKSKKPGEDIHYLFTTSQILNA